MAVNVAGLNVSEPLSRKRLTSKRSQLQSENPTLLCVSWFWSMALLTSLNGGYAPPEDERDEMFEWVYDGATRKLLARSEHQEDTIAIDLRD